VTSTCDFVVSSLVPEPLDGAVPPPLEGDEPPEGVLLLERVARLADAVALVARLLERHGRLRGLRDLGGLRGRRSVRGVVGRRAPEVDGNRDRGDDEQQGDRPEAALDEVANDVAKWGHDPLAIAEVPVVGALAPEVAGVTPVAASGAIR
jgi:hypothetical protein